MLEVQLNECLGDLLADTPSYTLFQIVVGSRFRGGVLAVILIIRTCVIIDWNYSKFIFRSKRKVMTQFYQNSNSSIMTKVQKFVIDCVEFQVDRVGNVRRDL